MTWVVDSLMKFARLYKFIASPPFPQQSGAKWYSINSCKQRPSSSANWTNPYVIGELGSQVGMQRRCRRFSMVLEQKRRQYL